MKSFVIALSLLGFATCTHSQTATGAPIKTTLCDISMPSGARVFQRVEIDADLYNAMPHGLFLGDRQCPKQRLQADYQTANADSSIIKLDKLVSLNVGNIGIIATGRFSGVIEKDRSSGRLFLSLKHVSELRSTSSPAE